MSKIEQLEKISEISADEWNSCVGADEPFARHEFLSSLEDSQCVHPQKGWMPQHLVLRDKDQIKACCPLYLKNHSYGEYVFDWSWAEAYERAGGRYYPKLQCAIPFTPVSGQRIMASPNATNEDKASLLSAMIERAQDLNISSLHITFAEKSEWQLMQQQGLLARTGHQYHWENQNYQNFDDFLAQLSSRKRKTLRKERRAVQESGVAIITLSGDEIKEHHWDAFYQFYMDTSARKWGHPYLNRDFFSLLNQRLGSSVVLVLVLKDEGIVAGALNLKGSETLYGRYWGCVEDYKFLHFETCYYQAIDYAIAHNLKRVEAGAQGQHKIQRGYLPVETYSAHWIADPAFEKAVQDFLDHDMRINSHEMQELAKLSPYKCG
ncbi:GNAT family N-acetyltransferase [Candidatus Terasakiella magnetica]|uniref:GNAT family N-acetyltransferase n=1 Tax=Candidatus Terasakiella magnetica TaxID=1867952 RepID=UPI001F0ACF57|nr:GNAT family N-acetyltransferase [Candidatus Terasakiella magnetica]